MSRDAEEEEALRAITEMHTTEQLKEMREEFRKSLRMIEQVLQERRTQ